MGGAPIEREGRIRYSKRMNMRSRISLVLSLSLFASGALLSSCSINRLATRAIADSLSGGGSGSTAGSFASDDDPTLVGEALPFALKMYETLLESAPDHVPLAVTTGSICVMYANAFVEHPAHLLADDDLRASRLGLLRAKKFYLRGLSYLERAAALRMKGWENIKADTDARAAALGSLDKRDGDLLYWYAASLLSAWALDPMDMALALRTAEARAVLERAAAIDPDYGEGSLDEIFLSLYASLPAELGGSREKALACYDAALAKSGGHAPGAMISLANLMIAEQDYPRFKEALEGVLALDPASRTDKRLVTILAQEKAAFLLDRAELLFWDLGDSGDDDWNEEEDMGEY